MNEYVREFGGSLVLDALGTRSPSFPNADYVFRSDGVVAELKCVSEDKSEDRRMQSNIEQLFERFVKAGRIPDPGYGEYRFYSKDCPVEFQRDLYRILARPIKKRLDKANRQIKLTKKHLEMPEAHGLVLLANDGNYRLEPAQFAHAVKIALGQDFSGIDSLVLFTANLLSVLPGQEKHVLSWTVASRVGHPSPPEKFLNRFFVGWTRHVGRKIGEDIPLIGPIGHQNLEAMKYDQKYRRPERT